MEIPRILKGDLDERTLHAIESAVQDAESETAGEVKVHILHRLLPYEKPRQRALREFPRLEVDRTTARSGVLVMLVMAPRRFEIVADVGIHEKVGTESWQSVAGAMTESILERGFEVGVCQGIRRIGQLLREHFPREPDDENGLADRPTVS